LRNEIHSGDTSGKGRTRMGRIEGRGSRREVSRGRDSESLFLRRSSDWSRSIGRDASKHARSSLVSSRVLAFVSALRRLTHAYYQSTSRRLYAPRSFTLGLSSILLTSKSKTLVTETRRIIRFDHFSPHRAHFRTSLRWRDLDRWKDGFDPESEHRFAFRLT